MWVFLAEMQVAGRFSREFPPLLPVYPLQASPATSPLTKGPRGLAGKLSCLAEKLSALAAPALSSAKRVFPLPEPQSAMPKPLYALAEKHFSLAKRLLQSFVCEKQTVEGERRTAVGMKQTVEAGKQSSEAAKQSSRGKEAIGRGREAIDRGREAFARCEEANDRHIESANPHRVYHSAPIARRQPQTVRQGERSFRAERSACNVQAEAGGRRIERAVVKVSRKGAKPQRRKKKRKRLRLCAPRSCVRFCSFRLGEASHRKRQQGKRPWRY